MVEPESASRAPSAHGPPGRPGLSGEPAPHVLQILTTEHWSLLASRSLVFTEAMSRASIYVAALTGSVVALALVSQATDFGDGFIAFALVLFPVDFFLGAVTIVRIAQLNREDAIWVQGMNRIRHAYLDMAPELEPYFVTSQLRRPRRSADVVTGDVPHSVPLQGFVAVPGVIAVLNAVVAGATGGSSRSASEPARSRHRGRGRPPSSLPCFLFILFARHWVAIYRHSIVALFPTPPAES